MEKPKIRERAVHFLNKRTKQKDNLVITRDEALSALTDFVNEILTSISQQEK